MKKLIIGFVALLAIVFITVSCDDKDNDLQIPSTSLPATAVSFLDMHFKDIKIRNVEKKNPNQANGTVYNVELVNGVEVDFDKEGIWKEVESDNNAALPTSFILPSIVSYITTNYAAAQITAIDKVATGFEVDLTNDIDLLFDVNGNFVKIVL